MLNRLEPAADNSPQNLYCLLLLAAGALVGNFLWDLPRKCVPTSGLFFIQEQMILYALITGFIPLAANNDFIKMALFTAQGIQFGGLTAFMTSQVRHLIIKNHRQAAESWSTCARGIGIMVGTPLIGKRFS